MWSAFYSFNYKIDELRIIAIKTNAAVIGITESKIDESVLDAEITIDVYSPVRYDRSRREEGWFVTLDMISLSTKLNYNLQIQKTSF